MTSYLKHVANLLYRLLIVIAIYSVCRVLFYLFNQDSFAGQPFFDLFKVFLFGARFDFSSVVFCNLGFIVLYLLPCSFIQRKNYQTTVTILFYAVNLSLVVLNLIDIEYFKYTNKRSSAEILSLIFMNEDVLLLIPRLLRDFWYIFVASFAGIFGGIYLMNRVPFRHIERFHFLAKQWVMTGLIFVLVLAVLILGARGTGKRAISIISAARYTPSPNIPLLLNTPFCIIHTLERDGFKVRTYFPHDELVRLFDPEVFPNPTRESRRDNVMIVILESFSREFIGSLTGKKSYTPRLDAIIGESLAFKNAFANGKQSMQALPAILASVPDLMDKNYVASRFAGNRVQALPSILGAAGYHTSFFHGGRNGTMHFDEFCAMAGIKHYYGLNEYEGPEAYDGNWGIYDEEFLQFVVKTLSSFPQPFFSAVYTLSSHHPYNVPDRYKKRFEAEHPQLAAMQYADYAVGEFFAACKTQPWFTNTLFVFVADHTAKMLPSRSGTAEELHRIPVVFYHAGDSSLRGIRTDVTQQADIMPSILDYLGNRSPYLAFGQSVFSGKPGFSINYSNGIYQYFDGDCMLTFDGERSTAPAGASQPFVNAMEQKAKAIIQQYTTRIMANKLYCN
jgi:arylsulfatase A-like enzyme